MPLREVLREAWRNVTTGTTRALVALVAFALVIGAIGVAQVRGVVGVAQDAQQWRAQGSSIQVVGLDGRIDGAQCDALASLPGVVAAGALRDVEPVQVAALPSSPLQAFEATPGLAGVLHLTTGGVSRSGVWLDESLAGDLGVGLGRVTVPRAPGPPMTVGGTYAYPADGRAPTLAYAVVAPVPPTGAFDACWVETWPESASVVPLLTLPVAGGSGPGGEQLMPMVRQLNPTSGVSFDAADRLTDLPTVPLTAAALLLAAALGLVLVRTRRLELASALHAGIDKPSLLVQVGIETIVWAALGCALVLPAAWWAAVEGNPDPAWSAFYPALRTAALAVVVVVVSTIVAGALTREKHLFRYFKQR